MSVNRPIYDFAADRRAASAWNSDAIYPNGVSVEILRLSVADGTAAGTYTGKVFLPPFSYILEIAVHAEAVWDAGTSAVLDVGTYDEAGTVIDADGFYSQADLTAAAELLVDENLSIMGNLDTSGGVQGAFLNVGTNTHTTDRFLPAGGEVRALITTVGTASTTGDTYVIVCYASALQVKPSTYAAT